MEKAPVIEFNYKKLKMAKDLTKKTLRSFGMSLMKKTDDENYIFPTDEEICSHLNRLARQRMIKHYVLRGESANIFLFNEEELVPEMNIVEVERISQPEVIKIQCYDEPVRRNDDVPIEISRIKELRKIPHSTFNSGTCVYFLVHQGVVVYVGQAENVHHRLIEHTRKKVFDSVYYMRVPLAKMNKIETALIAALSPIYNQTSKKMTNQKLAIANQVLGNEN